ncbi:Spore germination protein gerPA/gerPF [Schinkia azotoformans MEV2011]|uniref:Spore germination protein gerPA/gerPF n=1 Tax=Schinkia azotoformans MEV2011 TaxID=1348973 RepID=A0A072NK33_SCHAZ|nr:hypothetical protein [Schinkia azotoformans]KEF37283.1 Spore germination protein gerPA/gerPF [Schinkia azotoformans MEV2011]MEC1697541.1 hypothetical protein [Schinkia azotoformans]MEC1718480.1 hypothetical protein [Schinkia azotoformans]MEC1727391.1 hypothetical protein [Schinkia azotoformans]MEC1743648.1 hypothetical protein [Schinkia azotoformans]
MAIAINFVSIVINSQNTNAAVAIGENLQSSWNSHQKQNFGTGQAIGNTAEINMIINIVDNDVIDMPVSDNDLVPSNQTQAL